MHSDPDILKRHSKLFGNFIGLSEIMLGNKPLYSFPLCIGNSMVSSAIWKKTCTSEFFKDDRNCTLSPKDECNLKSLKNSRVYKHALKVTSSENFYCYL